MADESKNTPNPAKPADNGGGNIPAEKIGYSDVSIKGMIEKKEVQEAIRRYVSVPDEVTVKKIRKAFENKETKISTQKIVAMSGTTIEDAISHEITLLNTELDPVEAVNKKYRILDYMFALDANMNAGKFGGYAAKGLKLMVTRLEEVKGDEK